MSRHILVILSEHGYWGEDFDYPFITGRSTPDSFPTGQKIVEVLENGLTRYGWWR